MKKSLSILQQTSAIFAISALSWSPAAWAVDPFRISDIQVKGLQKIEEGTVLASMPVKVGDTYTDEKGLVAIRSLFALGLFNDVRLDTQGDVLVVIVQERPIVDEVSFIGLKEFEKDTLRKSLKEIGLAQGLPFDKALADRAEQELKRQYINRSLYGAQVVTTVTPTERGRVNLTFTIVEGAPARIQTIRIMGNSSVSESTLLSQMNLNVGNWMSWYTKSDRYSGTKLNADLEALRSYYLSRGYIDFAVESTQVSISPDKQDISIDIRVREGQRFIVSGVKLEGNYLERDNEFKSLIKIVAGESYNINTVTETTKAFTDYFGRFGYAFAKVQARPDIDRSNGTVVLSLAAEPQGRASVRRINISGNTRTRDEVIRRQLRQLESSWYDSEKIRLSRDRVDRLGFFNQVEFETQEVPGTQDQVDLLLTVDERPTGSFNISAGYSSTEKITLGLGFRQENAFGSGNYFSIDLNTSKYNRTAVLSSTDPYFTENGVSRTFDIFHRTTRPYLQDTTSYALVNSGIGLRFGIPVAETHTVYVGGSFEQTKIQPGNLLPLAYQQYADAFGYTSTSLPLSLGWGEDNRDSALSPTRGSLQRVNAELSPTGDARYIKLIYQYQNYSPINKQFTFAYNADIGWGMGLNGRSYPVFKNFMVGGLGSVRGFQYGTLGTPDSRTDVALGGAKKLVFNAELITPFPGAGNDKSLRMFAFADVGNSYRDTESYRLSSLRASAGVGVSWISPLGPLRFSYGIPLRKQSTDKIEKFQFQIGTSF